MPRYNPLANGKRRVRATSSSGLFRTTDADNCIVTQLVGNDAAEANDAPATRRSARIARRHNDK